MIITAKFEQTLAYVRRAGVCEDLETLLRPDEANGRPRQLAVDVLLAAMMLTYSKHKSLTLTRIHDTLTEELSRPTQVQYGIRREGRELTIRQVRYTWNAIADRLDHTKTRHPDLKKVERGERADHLDAVVSKLVQAASAHLGSTGRWAIDETAIDATARRRYRVTKKGKRKLASADPDARIGYRTNTQANRSNRVFGYQMTTFVRTGCVEDDDIPLLTEAIKVTPGNVRGTGVALETIDEFLAAEVAVTEILADRGITFSVATNWAEQLAARGVAQVQDVHPADRGARPSPKGYLMIDGWAHCPSIPEHLKIIKRPANLSVKPKPPRGKGKLAKWKKRKRAIQEFEALIAERATYRFEPVGKTSAGNDRFRCPARAGKLACDGCPLSELLPAELPRVQAPTVKQKACAQETITIPSAESVKLRQDLYWGSQEWIRSYSRRSRAEASYGVLKGVGDGGLQRHWTFQVGLVKTTLLLAIAVAAINFKQLQRWAKRTGDTRDPLVGMNTKGHGFVELDATGNPITGAGPPTTP